MTPGSDVSLAASTGPIWLVLLVHALAGTIGLVTGFIAVFAAKGGRWHRRAGMTFVVSMMVMAVFGTVVGTYEMKWTVVGMALTAYLVFTGLTTVRPVAGTGRTQQVALMAVALLIAVFNLTFGFIVLGTIALLAAIGDWRMVRAGGIQGTRKLARHLWRMCFALFIASGSFFLGQMQFFPEPLRILPLMLALGVAPLFVLLYWMWRVRLRHSLRGMTMSGARTVPKQA
jgi:hypothetical protein